MAIPATARDAAVDDAAAKQSPRSNSINSTRLNRFLVLGGVKLLRPFRSSWGPVLFLTPKTCVKKGMDTDLSEASTMRKSITYIVKENISREPVMTRWAQLSAKILGQLRTMIDEMRRIPKPDGRICNADGGSLWDCGLPTSLDRYGPFADTQELQSFLRNKLEKAPPHPEVDEMIELQKRDWGQPVFTHGDLSSLNILVHGDNAVGIVDWETAGWYPPYWEYTTASQVNIRDLWWADYIRKFLDPWPEAMAMEKTRQR